MIIGLKRHALKRRKENPRFEYEIPLSLIFFVSLLRSWKAEGEGTGGGGGEGQEEGENKIYHYHR